MSNITIMYNKFILYRSSKVECNNMHHKAILANSNIPKIILKHLILIESFKVYLGNLESRLSLAIARLRKNICTWPQICTLGKYINQLHYVFWYVSNPYQIQNRREWRQPGAAPNGKAITYCEHTGASRGCGDTRRPPPPPQLNMVTWGPKKYFNHIKYGTPNYGTFCF